MELLKKAVEEWKPLLQPVLISKVDEFHLLGYEEATQEDIWNCLVEKVWKGNPAKQLHEIVHEIFHLNTTVYMSYLTVNAYQDDDLLASIAAVSNNR